MREAVQKHRFIFTAGFFGFIITLLLIAQTAVWLNRTMFDTQRFTDITTTAIQAESSRQSIATAVVDRALEDRPAVKNVIGPRLSALIAGMLGSDLAGNALDKVVEKAQITVTTPRREPIVIDLTGLKTTIVKVQTAVGTAEEERRIKPENIPDNITLLDSQKLPNFYSYGVALLWLAPLSLLMAIGLLVWWVYRGRDAALPLRLAIAAGVLLTTALVGLLLGPLFKPTFLSKAETAQGQTLLENLYNGFLAEFNAQNRSLALLALLIMAGVAIWQVVAMRNKNARLAKAKVRKKK